MPALHIRNVSDETVALLKRRAQRHGHSLEAELRDILVEAGNAPPVRMDLSFETRIVLSDAPEPTTEPTRADAYSELLADGR